MGTGNDVYERAAVTAQLVRQVYAAEIAAGHYTTGNQLMFWMQGELDSLTIQAADYRQHFLSMYQDFTARVPVENVGSLPQELQPAHTNIRMIFILQALVLHSMVWVPARSCQTFMW